MLLHHLPIYLSCILKLHNHGALLYIALCTYPLKLCTYFCVIAFFVIISIIIKHRMFLFSYNYVNFTTSTLIFYLFFFAWFIIKHFSDFHYYLNPYLLEAKVISLCHQYRARPAFTSVQSDQALYCWLTNF